MNLFRSGEHVRRWLDGRPAGATIPVTLLSALAHAWWGDRLSPQWQPHAKEENEAILQRLGLVDEFWQLA